MPREMFVTKDLVNDKLPQGNVDRADKCFKYDLTTTRGFARFQKKCKNPWFQPGLTKIDSGCGVAGGNPVSLAGISKPYCGDMCSDINAACESPNSCMAGYPNGKGAEQYSYQNMPWTTWTRGNAEKVL